MNALVEKINALIEEKSLLKHPFYQMWSDGKLTKSMLSGYSKEYFQMVKGVPEFVGEVINHAPDEMIAGLRANQQEEADHIALWANFAKSLGIEKEELEAYKGFEKTSDSVAELAALMTSLESGAVAMYAFEKAIPEISKTKLEGLEKFYSMTSKDATEYFELHREADVRHAAAWEGILNNIFEENYDAMLEVASKSLDAQNHLLDSCLENYCQTVAELN